MKRFIVIAVLLVGACAFAQDLPDTANSFLSQQTAQAAREDQLYTQANDALTAGNYQDAARKFADVAQLKGRKADAALYWKAYALNKTGDRTGAATALADLRAQYPKSTWLKDATAMEMEWRKGAPSEGIPGGVPAGVKGGVPSGGSVTDDDIKAQALFGLMENDSARGVAICQDILKNPNQSPKLKERALFLLAQNDSPEAQQVIQAVAKGGSGPDLQVRAIRMIGVSGDRYVPELTEIYASTTDPRVKKAVLGAYMTSGAKGELLKAIGTEKDPEMRRAAIRQLGPMGASKELEQLYASTKSPEDQQAIIQALAITGDTSLLGTIAKSGANYDVRRRAIQSLGISGERSFPVLLEIYASDSNPEIRKSVAEALFVGGGCSQLVTLARKESDAEVKKRLIEKLSLMNCKEGRDYMIELLK